MNTLVAILKVTDARHDVILAADCTTDFLGDTSPPPPYVQVKAKVISPLDTSDLHAYTFLTLECVKGREFTKSEEKDWENQKFILSLRL